MKQEQKKNNVNLIVTTISKERRRDVTRKEGRTEGCGDVGDNRGKMKRCDDERRRTRRDGTTILTSPTNLDGQLEKVVMTNEIASSSIEKGVGDDDTVLFFFKSFYSFYFLFH
ncbi:hypothetical protein HID58_024873 [Brassica napus]|uniref:Uncharacterized protein n=1 Tax=Brassica napus TaxID=3708 RepID=A0ABQ8CKX0_BRANA|nr:hypothetical protein HID58_024873 [Brassica napus]